jgi:ubiquinone/menaquinone biosynthesis C-methylase UbiE
MAAVMTTIGITREVTGERMVPGESPSSTELQHWRRYRYFAHLATGRVLDVASGEGYGTAVLSRASRLALGIDLSDVAVRGATRKYGRQALHFVRGNALRLPLRSASVDRVFSFETIEHVPDPEQFLSEVKRVLAPNGALIVSTPNLLILSPGSETTINEFHVKEWRRDEFIDLMRSQFPHNIFYGQTSAFGWELHDELAEDDFAFISVASVEALSKDSLAPSSGNRIRRWVSDRIDFSRAAIHAMRRRLVR